MTSFPHLAATRALARAGLSFSLRRQNNETKNSGKELTIRRFAFLLALPSS